MDTRDFTDPSGAKVDRLTAVKQVLDEFLARRKGDRVGVVVFGNAPFTLVPFTTDLDLSRRLVGEMQVGMAGPRTAFGDAIGLGVNLFAKSTVPARTMIALTDGNDTGSSVLRPRPPGWRATARSLSTPWRSAIQALRARTSWMKLHSRTWPR